MLDTALTASNMLPASLRLATTAPARVSVGGRNQGHPASSTHRIRLPLLSDGRVKHTGVALRSLRGWLRVFPFCLQAKDATLSARSRNSCAVDLVPLATVLNSRVPELRYRLPDRSITVARTPWAEISCGFSHEIVDAGGET